LDFTAVFMNAGNHALSASIVWTTTDPTGTVSNGGRYAAGSVGTWYVNVTVAGSGMSASARVAVRPASLAIGAVLYPSVLAALVVGGVYSGYTVWTRRGFAVDDAFLVSEGGRLSVPNTRRQARDPG